MATRGLRQLAVRWGVYASVAFVCCALAAQDANEFLLAVRRAGVVEVIDPETLETRALLRFDFPTKGSGLNGVAVSDDGSAIYVEGPIPPEFKGCCVLYSVDLASKQVAIAASIGGTRSRDAFVVSDGVVYASKALLAKVPKTDFRSQRWHLSPDGRWLFGIRNFRGPALSMYDLDRGTTRELEPPMLQGEGYSTGVWSGDRFYLFSSRTGGGRLWQAPSDNAGLGAGIPVAPFGNLPNCSGDATKAITAAGGRLFIYEQFGFKVDRRDSCGDRVPGGAWVVDPESGTLNSQIAPDLHFSDLIPSRQRSELFGLDPGGSNWKGPVQLVRIDAKDGVVLRRRLLDTDVWRITVAPLRVVPSGDVGLIARGLR